MSLDGYGVEELSTTEERNFDGGYGYYNGMFRDAKDYNKNMAGFWGSLASGFDEVMKNCKCL